MADIKKATLPRQRNCGAVQRIPEAIRKDDRKLAGDDFQESRLRAAGDRRIPVRKQPDGGSPTLLGMRGEC
ncbi:MAG TPA: hypothetical protein VN456_08765 [Desulfosporosinus sp.]|nr:hypothetical protein [Desulfosporosinus sp.]